MEGEAGGTKHDPDRCLTEAILLGDEKLALKLLQGGHDPNSYCWVAGCWPLLAAVRRGSVAMVELLVRGSARSRREESTGRSELHEVAFMQTGPFPLMTETIEDRIPLLTSIRYTFFLKDEVKLWKLLMKAGADPSTEDEDGHTPLHIACANDNWPAVQYLLRGGFVRDVDQRDKRGQTALHHAAVNAHEDVVSLLLKNGAAPLVPDTIRSDADDELNTGHKRVAGFIERWAFESCPIVMMPFDVLVHVLALLEPPDLCAVASTCKFLNWASSADCLWEPFCDDRWTLAKEDSWKHRYITWTTPHLLHYFRQCEAENKSAKNARGVDEMIIHVAGPAGTRALYLDYKYEFCRNRSFGEEFFYHWMNIDDVPYSLVVCDMTEERQRNKTRIPPAIADRPSGVLLTYNIADRNSFDQAKQIWLTEYAQRRLKPVLLIVGLKDDLRNRSYPVKEEEAQQLAFELGAIGCVEVRLEILSEVKHVFDMMIASILASPQYARLPKDGRCWFPSEEDLERFYRQSLRRTRARQIGGNSCMLQ